MSGGDSCQRNSVLNVFIMKHAPVQTVRVVCGRLKVNTEWMEYCELQFCCQTNGTSSFSVNIAHTLPLSTSMERNP
jgi:hypothetical protein